MNRSFHKYVPGFIVGALLVICWFSVHSLLTRQPSSETDSELATNSLDGNVITLPDGKLIAANLKLTQVQSLVMEPERVISGRVQYDERKHIDVKAPLDGLLQEIVVTPGEQVEQGELLAIMRSPEIGLARSEVIKRQIELDLAIQVLNRDSSVAANLSILLAQLSSDSPTQTSDLLSNDSALGNYRQDILTAHTKFLLAQELLKNIQPLAESGAVPGRTILERQAEVRIARSQFQTACDQAIYNSNQSKLGSEAKVAEAQRQVRLAQHSLEALLGYKDPLNSLDLENEESLSLLEIRAPFSGTIESRGFANQERVNKGDSLLVLANTASLYIAANLRESDWTAISLTPGTIIRVEVPALEHKSYSAKISFVGREIDRDSRAIPIIATIDNSEGLLRPGMFVRVTLPIGHPSETLTVDSKSVVQHDNQSFVFVDMGGGRFRRVNVRTGHASEEWVEVLEGLHAGETVVSKGAFLLKSELLLQGEAE